MRMLFIAESPPSPTGGVAERRANLLHRALSRLGQVDLCLQSRCADHNPDAMDACRRDFALVGHIQLRPPGKLGPYRALRPMAHQLVDKLADRFADRAAFYAPDPAAQAWLDRRVIEYPYDLIVGCSLRTTAAAGALRYAPLIVDAQDVETRQYEALLPQPGHPWLRRALWKRRLRQLQSFTPDLLRRPEHVWAVHPDDLRVAGVRDGSVVPNIGACVDPSGAPRSGLATADDGSDPASVADAFERMADAVCRTAARIAAEHPGGVRPRDADAAGASRRRWRGPVLALQH